MSVLGTGIQLCHPVAEPCTPAKGIGINKPIVPSDVTECTKASTFQAPHGIQRQMTWVTRVVRMPVCCHDEEGLRSSGIGAWQGNK